MSYNIIPFPRSKNQSVRNSSRDEGVGRQIVGIDHLPPDHPLRKFRKDGPPPQKDRPVIQMVRSSKVPISRPRFSAKQKYLMAALGVLLVIAAVVWCLGYF